MSPNGFVRRITMRIYYYYYNEILTRLKSCGNNWMATVNLLDTTRVTTKSIKIAGNQLPRVGCTRHVIRDRSGHFEFLRLIISTFKVIPAPTTKYYNSRSYVRVSLNHITNGRTTHTHTHVKVQFSARAVYWTSFLFKIDFIQLYWNWIVKVPFRGNVRRTINTYKDGHIIQPLRD